MVQRAKAPAAMCDDLSLTFDTQDLELSNRVCVQHDKSSEKHKLTLQWDGTSHLPEQQHVKRRKSVNTEYCVSGGNLASRC